VTKNHINCYSLYYFWMSVD